MTLKNLAHKEELQRMLVHAWVSKSFSDCTLDCGSDNTFHLHKWVLSSTSPLLHEVLLQGDHISLRGFSLPIVEKVLMFIYGGNATLIGELELNEALSFTNALGMAKINTLLVTLKSQRVIQQPVTIMVRRVQPRPPQIRLAEVLEEMKNKQQHATVPSQKRKWDVMSCQSAATTTSQSATPSPPSSRTSGRGTPPSTTPSPPSSSPFASRGPSPDLTAAPPDAPAKRVKPNPPNKQGGTEDKICYLCRTSHTNLWRRHPVTGETACNACGLYYKLHQKERPLSLRNKKILNRRRTKKQATANTTNQYPKTPAGRSNKQQVDGQHPGPSGIRERPPSPLSPQTVDLNHSQYKDLTAEDLQGVMALHMLGIQGQSVSSARRNDGTSDGVSPERSGSSSDNAPSPL